MTDQSIARRNMAVLTAAQALGGASPPIVMSLGGLVGQHLAADPAWVTFPVSLFGVGLALGAPPAAFIMRRHGRRNGYLLGALFGVASGLVAAFGIFIASFWLFCIGAFTAGLYGAYVQSYRFAAACGRPTTVMIPCSSPTMRACISAMNWRVCRGSATWFWAARANTPCARGWILTRWRRAA